MVDPAARRDSVIAAINITPMADVMIVLLVIFMVVGPLLFEEPGLVLPFGQHGRAGQPPLTVSIRRDASLRLGGEPLDRSDLLPELRRRLDAMEPAQRRVWLDADRGLRYRDVAGVLELCRAAGAEQVGLVVTGSAVP